MWIIISYHFHHQISLGMLLEPLSMDERLNLSAGKVHALRIPGSGGSHVKNSERALHWVLPTVLTEVMYVRVRVELMGIRKQEAGSMTAVYFIWVGISKGKIGVGRDTLSNMHVSLKTSLGTVALPP